MPKKHRRIMAVILMVMLVFIIGTAVGCSKEEVVSQPEAPTEKAGTLTGQIRTAMGENDSLEVQGVEVLFEDGTTAYAYLDKSVTQRIMKDMEILVESYDQEGYDWKLKEVISEPEPITDQEPEEKEDLIWYLFYSGTEPKDDGGEARTLEILLSHKLDRNVTLEIAPMEHSASILFSGEAHVALLDFDTYVGNTPQAPYQVVLIPDSEFGSSYYRGEIVVPTQSPVQNISDLEGGVFAYTNRQDLAGYALVSKMIIDAGYNPASFFSSTMALQFSSEDMIDAVVSQMADAGVLYASEDFTALEWFGMEETLRVVDTTPWIPAQVLAVSEFLPEEETQELIQALMELKDDPEASNAMGNLYNGLFNLSGFHEPHPIFWDTYEDIQNALEHGGW